MLARIGVVLAFTGLVMGVSAPPAQAGERFGLVGPGATFRCDNLKPPPYEDSSQRLRGFVLFNVSGRGTVMALVSIKRGKPHTDYPVRLVQSGSGSEGVGCLDVDAVLRTNGRGAGTVRVSERAVGDRAQVIVDTGSVFTPPTYRATRSFEIG